MRSGTAPDPGPTLDIAYVPGTPGADWTDEEVHVTRMRILQVALGKPAKQIFGQSWDFYCEFTRQKGVKYAIKIVIYKSWDWFRPPPPSLGQNPNFYRKFVLKAPLIKTI